MARRRLTVRRIDPWSVLKFGAVVNLALLLVGLLVAGIVWMVVDRLQLVDQACSIALDVGFTQCGVNAGNLFRALILLGLLGVVVQTAVFVFLAFLHNLIADLTGGLSFGIIDDTPAPRASTASAGPSRAVTTAARRPASSGDRTEEHRSTTAGRPPVPPLGRETGPPPGAGTSARGGEDDLFGRD